MKTITKLMHPALAVFVLAYFSLSPQARAVCQEGCLTNSNTVLGDDALLNNTGSANTAIGLVALYSDTTGGSNTAIGAGALYSNTTGSFNTATGPSTLYGNTEGSFNVASGHLTLSSNTSGSDNTAIGAAAMQFNTTGSDNTAIGPAALQSNGTGNLNIALGTQAGMNVTGNSNIDIGNAGVAGESGRIRIGTRGVQTATFIAGISGATAPSGVGVIVGTNGKLGTVVSSARFKTEIKSMDKASEAILALKPVTFRYKKELDPEGVPQFGLVAEDVEKVNPDLVARDADGKVYTVRYEAVNAMLLNEFLKARRQIDSQQKQIDALTAGLQKVSAQLEASKPAPQIVNNNQ